MAETYTGWYGKGRKQDWRTPKELFDRLNRKYLFDLDGAASEGNSHCAEGSTEKNPVAWTGRRVFCNPPWSDIAPFIENATEAEIAVLLVPARPNAKWFHRALELGADVRYFKSRPRFEHYDKPNAGSSPVDCVLLVFGLDI